MNVLVFILSAVMTWTVKSKNTVTTDDVCPPYLEVQYSCSYQKGDVRAGDTAAIVFQGLRQATIEQVEVFVKSNKSAGAGVFTVAVNGTTKATQSGSLKDWTGAYDNTEYHPIALLESPVTNVDELSVSLVGTTNSLHIEKYVIRYTPASAHTVTLMKGDEVFTSLSEVSGGDGVVLPTMPDEGGWHFAAWSEQPFYTLSALPVSCLFPGTFYPAADVTLWAVYVSENSGSEAVATVLEDGLYCYADTTSMFAMKGAISTEGILSNAYLDANDLSQVYDIEFDTVGGTAVIYHPQSDTYIGYKGTSLVNEPSLWKVYHSGKVTAFYTEQSGKTYILWPYYFKHMGEDEYIRCADIIPTGNLSVSPTVLVSVDEATEEPVYTCHPEIGMGTEETPAPDKGGYCIPFGNYRLVIRAGQKILIKE